MKANIEIPTVTECADHVLLDFYQMFAITINYSHLYLYLHMPKRFE